MAEPLHRQLLSQARLLARRDPKRPQQGNLRRAVSSAYYAFFHFLTNHACRSMFGSTNDRRPYRDVLARAFEHSTMGKACKSFGGGTLPHGIKSRLPATFKVRPDLQRIAQTFGEAQEKRHLADYDRTQKFTRAGVLSLIRAVDEAMAQFDGIRSQLEAEFFLHCLLVWETVTKHR